LTESASYVYYEYPDNVGERLSYGENHPERKALFKILEESTKKKGYELKRLEELADSIEEKVDTAKSFPDESFAYLGLENIEPYKGTATFQTLLGKEILSMSKRFRKGDIVFAGLRPYLNKVHLVEQTEAIGSAELFVIKPKEELVIPDYLLKYLLSDLTLTQTKWILTGCSYPRLNPDDFKNLKIIKPTRKEEQEQILKRIEAYEKNAQQKDDETLKLSNRCRNVILEKLEIEMPSPNLFEVTSTDFYSDWDIGDSGRLDFVFHHPWMDKIRVLLSSFKTTKLGDLIEPQIEYGINASGKEQGSIPFINIQNMGIDGRLKLAEIGYIDTAEDSKLVHGRDILLSRSRLVGVCNLVTEKEDGFSFGSYILRLRTRKDSDVPPEYIVSFLNSDLGQAQIRMLETGAFGKNINTRQIKEIKVPLPHYLEDIGELVSEIQKMWRELDESEAETEKLWTQSRKKFAEVLLE